MKTPAKLLLGFFVALINIHTLRALPLTWTGSGTSATASSGTESYTLNIDAVYDNALFTGPLKTVDTTKGVSWIYDSNGSDNPLLISGQWHWRTGIYRWNFDIVAKSWSLDGGKYTWKNTGKNIPLSVNQLWINQDKNEKWAINDAATWKHFFTSEELTSATENWSYSPDSGTWRSDTRSISWVFDAQHLKWTRTDSSEEWTYNPVIESWTHTTTGAPANRWRLLKNNRWAEEYNGKEWIYNLPTGMFTVGTWQMVGGSTTWSYNSGTKRWVESGTGNTGYFPPHLPPPLVHQHRMIYELNFEVFRVFYTSAPTGSSSDLMVWSDGTNTLTQRYNQAYAGAWKMQLPLLGKTVGRGDYFDFDMWAHFHVLPENQKWDLGEISSTAGTLYRNTSSGIVGQETIWLTQNETWVRPEATAFEWVYLLETNKWYNKAMDALFSYNYATLTWQLDGGSSWKYIDNGGGAWVWHNTTANEKWQYEVSAGTSQWRNITTGTVWRTSGTALQDQSTMFLWQYVPSEKGWFKDGNTSTTKKDLFPFLPGDIAGYYGALAYIRINETTSITPDDPTGTGGGELGRFSAFRASLNSAGINTSIATKQGIQLFNALTPQSPRMRTIGFSNWYKADIFAKISERYIPTTSIITSDSFSSWRRISQRFFAAGKGAVRGISFNPGKSLVLGFHNEIPLTGSIATPLYRVEIDPSAESQIIRVYAGNTLLREETVTNRIPFMWGGAAIWFTYNNGHIIIGKDDPFSSETSPGRSGIIFDYQIADTTTAATVKYCAFAHLTAKPQTTSVQLSTSVPYDLFSTMYEIGETKKLLYDYLIISQIEEWFVRAKAEIIKMATTDTTTRERQNRANSVLAMIGTTTTEKTPLYDINLLKTAGIGDATHLDGYLHSVEGLAYTNKTYDNLTGAKNVVEGLLAYADSKLQELEKALTDLLSTDPSTLTEGARSTLLDSTTGTIDTLIGLTNANLSTLITAAQNLQAIAGNSDLAPFTNFYTEEIALSQSLGATLAILKKVFLSRFAAQSVLYATDTAGAKAAAIAAETERVEQRNAMLDTLATRLSTGPYDTLFTAVVTPALLLATKSTFDEVRNRVNSILIAQGETNFHTPPVTGSPLKTFATARTKIASLLAIIERTLNSDGNTFYNPFKGDIFIVTDPVSEVIVKTDATAEATSTSIINQQQSVVPGTSTTYRTNMTVETEAESTTQTMVREVKIDQTDKTQACARVYLKDALLALGNGNFTKDSGKSLSVLGSTQISPQGSAKIILNSDIIITANDALNPTKEFGTTKTDDFRCIPITPSAQVGKHEIIFHSDVERSIIIASGVELNLTGFAKDSTASSQRLVFSGKTRLVLEAGARIRLPYTAPDKLSSALTLAFTDEAEFVIQGTENKDEIRWSDGLTGSDRFRSKIFGVGTLEFSSHAKMKILRTALAGIEADYTSNITNITLSLRDSAQCLIGTDDIAGGALQIGNLVDGGSNHLDPDHYPNTTAHPLFGDLDTPFTPRPPHISFSLLINGNDARFFMGREAFFGIGAGTVNKFANPNGSTPSATTDPASDPASKQYYAWRLQSLFNVDNIVIQILNGTFSHHQVAPGNDKNSSLMAIGPLSPRAIYALKLTKSRGDAVLGGGNITFLRSGISHSSPRPVRIWNTFSKLAGGSADQGKYSILAPAKVIMKRQEISSSDSSLKVFGRGVVVDSSSFYQLICPQDEFFLALTMRGLTADGRIAVVTGDGKINYATFVTDDGTITTNKLAANSVKDSKGTVIDQASVPEFGYLTARDAETIPQVFTKPTG